MTYRIWARLGQVPTSTLGIADEGTVKTQVDPSSTVSALGKFTVNHYLTLGVSFKRIFRRDQFPSNFGQKWDCVGIDVKVMIWIPTKGRL